MSSTTMGTPTRWVVFLPWFMRLPDSTAHEQLICLVWCRTVQGGMLGNQRHGQGTHTSSNCDVYQGSWRLDQRHGRGRFTTTAGLTYDGDWVEDKAQGWVCHVRGSKDMSSACLCTSLQDTLARYMQQRLRADISDCLDQTVQCMGNHLQAQYRHPQCCTDSEHHPCTNNAACMSYSLMTAPARGSPCSELGLIAGKAGAPTLMAAAMRARTTKTSARGGAATPPQMSSATRGSGIMTPCTVGHPAT